MDLLLKETLVIVRKIHNIIIHSIVSLVSLDQYISSLNSIALRWKTESKNTSKQERILFFKNNIKDLYFIHENLVGTTISTHHKKLISKFRSSHDTIFASLDIKRPIMKFKYLPTMVFTEFLKGITYFKTDNIYETPIYHRANSCGTGTLTIKDKFGRKTGYSNDDAMTNIIYIRRCYIERQIYNDIFKAILYKQDIAHLKELEMIKRLYDSKVPNSQLTVTVSHYEAPSHLHPTKLFIIYDTNHSELYLKTQLSSIIRCEKTENGKVFHKIQTFEKEMPWNEGPLNIREKIKIKPLTV